MRVVGGELSGRRLKVPPSETRPTADRVREALASALQSRDAFAQARVLDLFAGSGALGFEALSRGATDLLAVDQDRRAVACVLDNARSLGVGERTTTLKLGLLPLTRVGLQRLAGALQGKADLVFVDPPYRHGEGVAPLVEALIGHGLLAPGALLVLERASRDPAPEPAGTRSLAQYRYGDTAIALLELMA